MKLLTSAVVVAAATACASASGGAADTKQQQSPESRPVQVATHDGRSGATLAALANVRLAKRDVDGTPCVVLLDAEKQVRPVSFPEGYTATEAPLEVHDESGRVVMREGLVFGLAGGSSRAAPGTACVPQSGTVWNASRLTPLDDLPSPWPQINDG